MKPLSSLWQRHVFVKLLSRKALGHFPWVKPMKALHLAFLSLLVWGSWLPAAKARPRLALQAESCRQMSFENMVALAKAQGTREVQLQVTHLDPAAPQAEHQRKKFHLQNQGIRAYAGRYAWSTEEAKNRRLFQLAKTFEMDFLVLELPDFQALDQVESLAQEFDLRVAIRPPNEVDTAPILQRDSRIGLSLELKVEPTASAQTTKLFLAHHSRVWDLEFQAPTDARSDAQAATALQAWKEALKTTHWKGVMALSTDAKIPAEALTKVLTQGKQAFRQNFIQHQFSAAAVKKDITPTRPQPLRGYPNPRISEGFHDRINHRIVVMDDGEETFVLISSDLCNVPPATSDRFTQSIARNIGIPSSNIWWTVTHTHSAPYYGMRPGGTPPEGHGKTWDSSYDTQVEEALMKGVLEARSQLAPAKLGVGWGHASANINRRARGSNGGTGLGMNPEGPVDRRIGLIRLDHASSGKPIALIANYAMHGTVLGSTNTMISGDAQGYVSNFIEQQIAAPVLYINGAAGNIAPIYSVPSAASSLKNLPYFKALLADKILEANQRIQKTTDQVRFQPKLMRVESATNSQRVWPETLKDYRRSEGDYPKVGIPLRMLQINDNILLWALPLETFSEIAIEVRERSSIPYTFYYGYTGGGMGYLPSPEEFPFGGYEVGVSYFTPSTPGLVIDAVLEVANPSTSLSSPAQP